MIAATTVDGDNEDQPMEQKLALEAANPPGIAARLCDPRVLGVAVWSIFRSYFP